MTGAVPRLEVFQSLWAMELRRPDGRERSLEESFRMVAEAGYDGMAIDLGATDLETARQTRPLFERYGLGCLINAFPQSVEDLRPVLEMAVDFEARFVNVIGQVMPLTVAEAAPVVRAWLELSAQAGMPILFETHRNCMTNDLYFTLLLMDAVPEMRLCADLSHFLVDREFPYPPTAPQEEMIRRVLARADSFQGRVASREQIQVQLDFPQHRKWVELFERWWEDGMRLWLDRASADAVLNFLCELGPPEYAITGPDGYELSDRWAEALAIRASVTATWDRLTAGRPEAGGSS